jgi:hypothetical protein
MTPFEFVITPGNDVGNYHRSYISVSVTVVLTRRLAPGQQRRRTVRGTAATSRHQTLADHYSGVQQAVGRAAPGTPRRVRHAGLPAVAGSRCPPFGAGGRPR